VTRSPKAKPAAKAAKPAKAAKTTNPAKVARPAKAAKTSNHAKAAKPFAPPDPVRVARILALLEESYPKATTALGYRSPLQLLCATILSAQCTDVRVNQVTPMLFAKFPDAASLAAAPAAELEEIIHSTGFFRAKAKSIKATCKLLAERHGGEVPRTMEAMLELRGVARKTANVVLGNAYGLTTGIVVDTHVRRLAERLGLSGQEDPEKIERELMAIIPEARWIAFSHQLILHGRAICVARKPRCGECPLAPHCPSAVIDAES
jgi:endonuclease-3